MAGLGRRAHFRFRTSLSALVAAVLVAAWMVAVAAPPASATTANPTPAAGSRRSATQLPFAISGTANLSVDVATGNALFTDTVLTLPGVTADVPITLSYNSTVFGTTTPSAVTGAAGSGWAITGFDQRLVVNADSSVTYYGTGGLSGVFVSAGGGTYTSPMQFQATLTYISGTGYALVDHTSQTKLTFTTGGRLSTIADRNGNLTTFGYNGYGYPATITSSRGPSAGRLLTIATGTGGRISTLTQTSGTLSRVITLGYTTNGHLGSVTDDVSGVTSFASAYGTDTGQVVTITNPKSKTTVLSFATGGQVSQVAQANPDGAGTSYTRLTYPSSSSTLVADPTTNQSSPVSSVPHTAYTLTTDGSMLVLSAVDPDSNTRAATYTSLAQVATSTPAAGGATTFTYGANSGESLTSVAASTGATDSATYTNTGAAQYLPTSTTNDASNTLNYTYNGQGNQLTSTQGTSGPSAVVTYNTDGTVATSASPGAATGVVTTYTPDANHDISTIAPPSGTSLGTKTYTWDGFGRLATATDGRGNTTTYTYDNADRITKIHSSATGTADVTYTYNALNRVTQRVDASGTTTYTYDDLSQLLTVANTAGGGTITYTYDLAGALATENTALGTTSYGYDAAHELTSMTYPQSGTMLTTEFTNDANGRRTSSYLQSNAAHSAWAAWNYFGHDASGRLDEAVGINGPATASTNLFYEGVCYTAGDSPATGCPGTPTSDRSDIVFVEDFISGQSTAAAYDSANRLHTATVTGGSNPLTDTYCYDSCSGGAGNRTSATVTGSSPSSQTLTYNAANQITTTGYTYDGAGNLTAWPGHTATYNGDEQQTSTTTGGVTTTYAYAGANQDELVKEATSGGSTYNYAYGRTNSQGIPEIESVNVGGGTGYLLNDNDGQPVMLQTTSAVTCLYLYDGFGNPVALANDYNSNAYTLSFDPYGNATRTDTAGSNGGWTENPYMFQGGLQDRATGLVKFGARWYNTSTGSWTQQDPMNAPLDPSNGNRYLYAAGDPVNEKDPSGRCNLFGSCLSEAVSAAAGAVAGSACGLAALVCGGATYDAVDTALNGGSELDIAEAAGTGAAAGAAGTGIIGVGLVVGFLVFG